MPLQCPTCGMTFDTRGSSESSCPKCDSSLRPRFTQGLFEIDVAHRGETWEVAERRILQACSQALFAQHQGLKVIHGYGSGRGHTSRIRSAAIPLLHRLARQYGGKVVADRNNPGAHLLYFE